MQIKPWLNHLIVIKDQGALRFSALVMSLVGSVMLSGLLSVMISQVHLASARSAAQEVGPAGGRLYDTLRVIRHPQGADHALAYLRSRSLRQLRVMQTRELERALIDFACLPSDQLASLTSQQAARAIQALELLSRFTALYTESTCIRRLWHYTLDESLERERPSKSPPQRLEPSPPKMRSTYGHRLIDLVARGSAESLYRLGRVDLLLGATRHPDPHIRTLAARSGAEPSSICKLSKDAWPEVRLGAVRGLSKVAGPESICLIQSLRDVDLNVRLGALKGLSQIAQESWAQQLSEGGEPKVKQLHNSLRATFQNSRATMEERRAALVALALWGVTDEANEILNAHFLRGGLIDLSRAALYSIVISVKDPLKELRRAIERSPSPALQGYAASLLVDPRVRWGRGDDPSRLATRLSLIKQVSDKLRGTSPRTSARLDRSYQQLYLLTQPEAKRGDEPRDLAPPLESEDD